MARVTWRISSPGLRQSQMRMIEGMLPRYSILEKLSRKMPKVVVKHPQYRQCMLPSEPGLDSPQEKPDHG